MGTIPVGCPAWFYDETCACLHFTICGCLATV